MTVPTAVWFSAAVNDAELVNFAASFTSVTVTVIVCDAVFARVVAPDDAVTTTTYTLSFAALDGVVLTESEGESKSGADLNDSTPPASVISNRSPSAPPVIS